MPQLSGRLGYSPALDGLRGVAIAAVVLYHNFRLPGGYLGVDLFFVLSGFLITTLLLEDGRLGSFYLRRARRLLPAVGMLLALFFPLIGWAVTIKGGLYFANVFRAFAHPDPLTATPFDHLWSLAEEEQFYLVWPLLLLALGGRRSRRVTVVLAAAFVALVAYRVGLGISGASWRRIYFAPDTHADGLVLGCLAAVARVRCPSWLASLCLALMVALFAVASTGVGWLMYGLPAFELAAVLVVVAAADGRLGFLRFRPLVGLGLISYSLYLWHQPARYLFGWGHPLPAAALGLGLAVLSYRYVEKPFRRAKTLDPLPHMQAASGADVAA